MSHLLEERGISRIGAAAYYRTTAYIRQFTRLGSRVTYPLSLGVALLSYLFSKVLAPLGGFAVYFPFIAAVFACALLLGVGPALSCELIAAFTAFNYVVQPTISAPADSAQISDLIVFFVLGTCAVLAASSVRRLSEIAAKGQAPGAVPVEALYDALTGLPNRVYFRDRLKLIIAAMDENTHSPAVLLLDLDRFNIVNGGLGHEIGDRLLRAIAKRIESALRSGETLARFGSDEFAVLIQQVTCGSAAVEVAMRLQQSLLTPFGVEEHTLVVTASIGIALAQRDSLADEVLRHAVVALDRAKALGGDRCEVFEAALDAWRLNLVQLESEIRKGLVEGQFLLHYQPIIALDSGELSGVEALVRWRHPSRGLLRPAEFVPAAEESALINELGTWVLETATAQLSQWQAVSPLAQKLYVTVNIAQRQLVDLELPILVLSLLQRNKLQAGNLILELTENIIEGGSADAIKTMRDLQRMGIRLAIDDFGKGHSSLARLQELPISMLKLDCAFIQSISEARYALADAIVALGNQLGMEVTAECVETREQLEQLFRNNCTAAQGNFFSPPMDGVSILNLIQSQKRWQLDRGVASGS